MATTLSNYNEAQTLQARITSVPDKVGNLGMYIDFEGSQKWPRIYNLRELLQI